MNGSADEQHDAHVKCYRIAVAVAWRRGCGPNHASGLRGGIAGVYDKSELLPERRTALELWVAHVEGLVAGKPTKVVSMRTVQK
jgi:hypothetical protein